MDMNEEYGLTPYETREILFYKTDNGEVRVEILLYQENLWLTQAKMAELFEVQKAAISKHLKNIFTSGELQEEAVVSKMEITDFSESSPVSKIFFKCLLMAGTPTSNSVAIAFCVHQIVSSLYVTCTPFSLPSITNMRNSAVLFFISKFFGILLLYQSKFFQINIYFFV